MAHKQSTVMGLLKARLNRLAFDGPLKKYFSARIAAADEDLARSGIHLRADSVDDAMFLADYVAWKHLNRDTNEGMPEWLRLARRERWLADRGLNQDDP